MLFISNTGNNSHSDVAHGVQANGVQTDLPFLFVKEEEGDEPVPPISFWMLANTLLTSLLKQPFLYFS